MALKLWKTDGTSAGTKQVTTDIANISWPLITVDLVNGGPTLFFAAYDGKTQGLWRSDGTASGTTRIKSFGTDDQAGIQDMVAYDHQVVFDADDGVHGDEPWHSDGTAAGTAILADVTPGKHGTYWEDVTDTANGVYFWSFDSYLYKIADAAGKWTVAKVAASSVRDPDMITDAGSGLVFYNYTGGFGKERLAGLPYSAGAKAYGLPNVDGTSYLPVSWAVNDYQSIAYNPSLNLIFGVLQVKGYGPEPVVGKWSS